MSKKIYKITIHYETTAEGIDEEDALLGFYISKEREEFLKEMYLYIKAEETDNKPRCVMCNRELHYDNGNLRCPHHDRP